MSENIQLQKVSVDGMVIKMRCDDVTEFIVGRMLHRRKFLNLLPFRKYNDTSRMLAGRSSDAGTPLYDSVDLTVTFMLPVFLVIIFHITERRFLRQRANRSCLKGLPFSENNLRIFVCICLVLS